MIQPLFMVLGLETVGIVLLLFKTPVRKYLILGLDRLKRGRAPLVVKSVGATVMVIMMYNVYTIREMQSRPIDTINPTDQVLLANHILEASLMGFLLFLSLMIDRLHHYMRELRLLRKAMEAAKKQTRSFEDGKNGGTEDHLKALNMELALLRGNATKLESECESKEKEGKAAEANSLSLQNQSEGFRQELERLAEENESLRNQLQSMDQSLSHSDGKKNT